jgi:hypothetical protein
MKIGSYTIPNNRLKDLIEDTKRIYEKFPSEEVEAEFIAHTIGNSPKSGSFRQKLADLRSYGLLEGRGKIRVSELGKTITYGHASEKIEAFEKILKNIPLWGIFLDRYGISIKEDSFWVDLAKITGVERPLAQNKAEWVRKIYMEDARYLDIVKKPLESSDSNPKENDRIENKESSQPPQIVTNAIGYIGFPEYSKAPIEIKDEISYNIAKQLLEAIGKKLKEKEAPKDNIEKTTE